MGTAGKEDKIAQLTKQSRLDFGKHKRRLLQWVIDHDPEYVLWCQENIEWFYIDQDAEDALEWAMADVWDDDVYDPLDSWHDGWPGNYGDR